MRKEKYQQAPVIVEASSLADKLEKNPTLRFVTQNGRLVLYVVIALALLFYVFYRIGSNNKLSAQKDYIQAEQHLSDFQNSGTTDAFSALQKILDKRPELHAKYDGLIAQTLIKRGTVSEAQTLTTKMFERTESDSPTLHVYQDYSQTSLLISKGEYEKALKQTLALQERIQALNALEISSQTEQSSLLTITAFNQLRIALLYQQMKNLTEEYKAWETLEQSLSQNQVPIQLFQKGKVSLHDYIEARKQKLNN